MATSNPTLTLPEGTTTQALVRVQELAARSTSTGPVLPGSRRMATTADTVDPARTWAGMVTDATVAVDVDENEHVAPPPADAGPAVVRPTAAALARTSGRASIVRTMVGPPEKWRTTYALLRQPRRAPEAGERGEPPAAQNCSAGRLSRAQSAALVRSATPSRRNT